MGVDHSRSVSSALTSDPAAAFEIVNRTRKYPIQLRQRFRNCFGIYVASDDRHHAFVMRRGVRDLACAHFRCNGIGCKHENETVGTFNRAIDRLHEFFRRPDAFPIDPRFPAASGQRFVEATDEFLILARIRDEDFLWPRNAVLLCRRLHSFCR